MTSARITYCETQWVLKFYTSPKQISGYAPAPNINFSYNFNYREHWIQRITFAAETNATTALHTAWQRDVLLRSLSDGEDNRRNAYFTSQFFSTLPVSLCPLNTILTILKTKLGSTGYGALPSPPRLMQRTNTHSVTAWQTPSDTIPSPLAKRRRR